MLVTFLLTLVIIVFLLVGLSLRMILVKDGEFRGGCATNSPFLKNEIGDCQVCGAKPEEACKNELPELPK
ncbi:MAG: hypothetical protein HKN92_05360 [Chitinophagales bacterium]|nr:hypothetical protein [Chitinophagales bacterium]